MASNRPALNNVTTAEMKTLLSNKNALAGGKPKGSKTRTRNEMCMEKLENAVSLSSKRKIESILSDVNSLGDVEKMLLYLRLPTGFSESEVSTFSKSSPTGPNSTREEHTKAFNWICTHLEESPDTSMRKSDVYEDYKIYCDSFKVSAVCAADFGKIMKGVFPNMKRRRLGTRGNSRYCYSGIRKKADMKSPVLPQLDLSATPKQPCPTCPDHQVITAAAGVLCTWEKKYHAKDFGDIIQCAQYLIQEGHIPKESDPAKAFLSALEDSGKSPKLSRLDQTQEAWLQRSPEERRREANHQLQLKLQQKQIAKDQQRKEEEERQKSLGVQVSENSIDSTDMNCETVSQSKETTESTTETTQSTAGGSNMVSPKPWGTNGNANFKEKDSPKKKLTPIQPKTPLRNVCLIPVPFPPTDNQPLKLIYMPNTGKKLAIPASMNLPGAQTIPGSPFISSQACQNAVTYKNKVIVPVSAGSTVQLQATQPKPTTPATVQCSNGQQVIEQQQQQQRINIQGSKVNQSTAPPTPTLVTAGNQWQNQPKVINQGIALTVSEGTNIPVLQTNQIGVMQNIISADSFKGTQQSGGIVTPMVQGIRNPQKHTLIMSGNKQCGIISVPQASTDIASSPENSVPPVNDMVLLPNTLSNNIPTSPLELVISQSNQNQNPQQKYLLSNPLLSKAVESRQATLSTSVANLANLSAILNQSVQSQIEKAPSLGEPTASVKARVLNQTRPVLTRGNSLPSSVTVAGSSKPPAVSQSSSDMIHPSASNLLRSLTKLRMHEAGNAAGKCNGQTPAKEHQPKLADKDVKSSRLLEELLRPTPAKVAKPATARRNPQPRPKSVAGILENKMNAAGKVAPTPVANNQKTGVEVLSSSLYPSISINQKKPNRMQTVSGMSAAMMLPQEFRGKLEQQENHGDSAPTIQQGNNQMQVAFSPQGITLITQESNIPGSPKIVMQLPTSTQSQLLGMLPNAVASSPHQVAVGSPASNSGHLSSAPSTPLANLGSPEAMASRSSNNTPMSEIGSVPVSPAQPQQAQLFFVPINQGQGLDPALISVNNKSPVKPKQRQVFFAPNNPASTMVEAPLDLSNMREDVAAIQQMQQNAAAAGTNVINAQLNRKRRLSGGVLMVQKQTHDLAKSLALQNTSKGFMTAPASMNTITDMPPPSSLPQMGHVQMGKGKPILGGRVASRGSTVYRKRNVSGPSVSLQTLQQQVNFQQTENLNIPVHVSSVSELEKSERERSLAKRSQSVPLPELSESLQDFIIDTKTGEEMTATDPEEIEKSLKKFEPIQRGIHANLNQFGAKRNLSTQLQGMPLEQEQRDQANDAMFNEFLNVLTEERDENENPRNAQHLIVSTGSGNCASSQTEITPPPGHDPQWSGLEQTLAQAQPSMTLVDTIDNANLELQSYSLEPFGSGSGLELISPFSTSVTM